MLAKESKATVMKMLTELEKRIAEHSGNQQRTRKYRNQSELMIMITEMKNMLEGIQAS